MISVYLSEMPLFPVKFRENISFFVEKFFIFEGMRQP